MRAPEPKAPASGLDAAVRFMEEAGAMLGRGEMPAPGTKYAADWWHAHRTLLDALSSQSQAAEGMAKALEPFSEIAGRYLTGGLSSDLRSRAPDLIRHFDARSFYAARTALSRYRTLGDRHVD